MSLLVTETACYLRPDRVVRVGGPDRLSYLHSMLSQHMDGATPGTVAEFLLLDAKGDPKAVGTAVVHAEAVYLVVPPALATGLAEFLDSRRFLMQVEVADLGDTWAIASIRGDGTVDAPGARREPMTAAPHGDGLVLRDRDGGVDLLGPLGWVQDRVADLDLPAAGPDDWERWRILAGRPAWGTEVADGRRTQELGMLPTHVHLRKGCYPGQESIAKIYNLGRPRRALAVVRAKGPLAPGDPLGTGRRPGEVTSASSDGDQTVALALVPLDREGDLPSSLQGPGGVEVTVEQRVGAGMAQPGA